MDLSIRILKIVGYTSLVVFAFLLLWSLSNGYVSEVHKVSTLCSVCVAIVCFAYASILSDEPGKQEIDCVCQVKKPDIIENK